MRTAVHLSLLFLRGILPLGQLYVIKLFIDAAVRGMAEPNASLGSDVLQWVFLLGFLAMATIITRSLAEYVQEVQGFAISERMQEIINAKAIVTDLEFYEDPSYRDTLHRAQQEALRRPMQIVLYLSQIVQSGISLVMIGGLVAWTTHWQFALLLAVAAIPALALRVRHSRESYDWQRTRTSTERESEYYHWMLSSADHAKEVRLFNLGGLFSERASGLRKILHREKLRLTARRSIAESATQCFAMAVLLAIFGSLAHGVLSGALTIGSLVMQYQIFQRGLAGVQEMVHGVSGFHENQLFLNRLQEFLDLKPRAAVPGEALPVPLEMRTGIVFENVSFKYRDAPRPVLENVSFKIAPGEMVALVGENGAGKSTIVKLLCRLYDPTEGRITFDGVDLRELDRKELWGRISAVFQDFNQFQVTATENVWFGRPDGPPNSAKIKAAARESGADEVIESLPQKYEQRLGRLFQGGRELSVGQWQKIALARAFYRNTPIIVLDEPSSALDVRAEHEVFQQFKTLTKGRTSIVISHRLSTVRMADRIYVLEHGGVTEAGSHEELMTSGGTYAELFATQASSYR